jgi:hypothetical protein
VGHGCPIAADLWRDLQSGRPAILRPAIRQPLILGLEGVLGPGGVGDSPWSDPDHAQHVVAEKGGLERILVENAAFNAPQAALPRSTSPCIDARAISKVATVPTPRVSTITVARGRFIRFRYFSESVPMMKSKSSSSVSANACQRAGRPLLALRDQHLYLLLGTKSGEFLHLFGGHRFDPSPPVIFRF